MKNYLMKLSLLGFLCIGLFFSACAKKEKYTLEYKLTEGQSFKQNIEMEVNMSQNLMGREINTIMDMTMNMGFTVREIKDSLLSMSMTYDKIKMNMNMNAGEIMSFSLDSDTENDIASVEDMSPLFKSLIGSPLTITTDKKGTVKSVDGFNELFAKMINAINPEMDEATKLQMLSVVQGQISEESVQSMMQNSFAYFPEKEVSIGDIWEKNISVVSNGIEINTLLNITLKSVDSNLATLTCDGTFSTPEESIADTKNGTAPAASVSGTMSGTIVIDMNTGITTKADLDQNMNGSIMANGTEFPLTVVNKITITN